MISLSTILFALIALPASGQCDPDVTTNPLTKAKEIVVWSNGPNELYFVRSGGSRHVEFQVSLNEVGWVMDGNEIIFQFDNDSTLVLHQAGTEFSCRGSENNHLLNCMVHLPTAALELLASHTVMLFRVELFQQIQDVAIHPTYATKMRDDARCFLETDAMQNRHQKKE